MVKMPVESSNTSFITMWIHYLSKPPASLTFSPINYILTSLCMLTFLYSTKLVIKMLDLYSFIKSAPFSQPILFLSNLFLNHCYFYWKLSFLASAAGRLNILEFICLMGFFYHLNFVNV